MKDHFEQCLDSRFQSPILQCWIERRAMALPACGKTMHKIVWETNDNGTGTVILRTGA